MTKKSSRRTLLFAGLWFSAANSVVFMQPIQAQVGGGESAQADIDGADIVVTATRREARLEDVPLSLEVMTASDISGRGASSGEDFLRGVPAVNQIEGPFNQSIVIRGIEASPDSQNFSVGTTVATYFGEVPLTNSAGLTGNTSLDARLVDIERVEILRGPQGTAFGNSSLGGAIRTIPVAPRTDRIEGKVVANVSVTEREGEGNYMGQGVLNIPLVEDRIAVRGSTYYFKDSGFYTNVAASNPDAQAAAATIGAQGRLIDIKDIGDARIWGGRIAALIQPSDPLKVTLTYLNQQSRTDGFPIATLPGYQQGTIPVLSEHVNRGQQGGSTDSRLEVLNGVLEYNLGKANVVASYSHVNSGSTQSFVFVLPAYVGGVSQFSSGKHKEDVGEIRLVTNLGGPIDGIVGVYKEKLRDIGEFDYGFGGDPALNPLVPGARFNGIYLAKRKLKQTAVFGELSWKILPDLTLTGGARRYKYDRTSQTDLNGPLFGGSSSTPRDLDATGTSYRVNLSYKPNARSIIYAGWSQGFRLGSSQLGLAAGACDTNNDGIVDGTSGITIDETTRTDSDSVNNYEVGGRASLLRNHVRVSGALFRIDWKNIPIRLIAQCGFSYIANAGSARSEGAEFQLDASLTDAWQVSAGFSLINARLTEDVPSIGATSGTKLPGSPSVNANLGLEYRFEAAQKPVAVRADAIYVGPFYGNLSRLSDTKAGDYVKLDLSARVTLSEQLTASAFVKNVFNTDSFTFRGINDGGGAFYGQRLRPRTTGFQLGYDF